MPDIFYTLPRVDFSEKLRLESTGKDIFAFALSLPQYFCTIVLIRAQRPGTYINAGVSGGRLPSWLSRNPGILHTRNLRFVNATDSHSHATGEIIARVQNIRHSCFSMISELPYPSLGHCQQIQHDHILVASCCEPVPNYIGHDGMMHFHLV